MFSFSSCSNCCVDRTSPIPDESILSLPNREFPSLGSANPQIIIIFNYLRSPQLILQVSLLVYLQSLFSSPPLSFFLSLLLQIPLDSLFGSQGRERIELNENTLISERRVEIWASRAPRSYQLAPPCAGWLVGAHLINSFIDYRVKERGIMSEFITFSRETLINQCIFLIR